MLKGAFYSWTYKLLHRIMIENPEAVGVTKAVSTRWIWLDTTTRAVVYPCWNLLYFCIFQVQHCDEIKSMQRFLKVYSVGHRQIIKTRPWPYRERHFFYCCSTELEDLNVCGNIRKTFQQRAISEIKFTERFHVDPWSSNSLRLMVVERDQGVPSS